MVNISLTVEEFCALFQIPSTGARSIYRESDLNFGDIDRQEGEHLVNVFRDITVGDTLPSAGSDDFPSRELRFHEYLAHRAMCKVIFPLRSTTDSLSFYQAFYIYALKHRIHVDFATAIFVHMSHALSHPKNGLPYGHIITHILRSYPIAFSGVISSTSCGITISSMGHMKMAYNTQFACWTWRNIQATNLGNPIRNIPPAPPAPTVIPESSSSSSHGGCAPMLKKIASLIKSTRRHNRAEYERTKARQNELYRFAKEKMDFHSEVFENDDSPSDSTGLWSGDGDTGDADIGGETYQSRGGGDDQADA